MIDEMVNSLLAAVVVIDGVPHVPVMAAIQTLVPVFFAGGVLAASSIYFMHMVLLFCGTIGELLGDWLRNRLEARKASKAEEIGVWDPQILEALDKLPPEELTRLYNSVWAHKTES